MIEPYCKTWYRKNRQYKLQQMQRYHAVNREKVLRRQRKWRLENRMVIKVARGLQIPIPQARELLGGIK